MVSGDVSMETSKMTKDGLHMHWDLLLERREKHELPLGKTLGSQFHLFDTLPLPPCSCCTPFQSKDFNRFF